MDSFAEMAELSDSIQASDAPPGNAAMAVAQEQLVRSRP